MLDNLVVDRIIYVRHGETPWNVSGRLQGQRDIPLDPAGREQAAAAGASVKTYLGADFDRTMASTAIWCSPLLRTRETMEIALGAMGEAGRPFAMDDRLKEISFGDWEGMMWSEVDRIDPTAEARRARDKWGFVPPGGESYAQLVERIKPFFEALSGDALVVSHGGVARALMNLIGGLPGDEAAIAEIHQGRVLIFEGDRYYWI
ncbi:MAG: histidine phosphatase family protein [Hyphomicrobiales bacterium]|nr:phosphoglycerate mutase family protein [Hyphomicrobiales bacterium]MDE2018438.1 histidine phosphatase family protein [Hyphomicrobiales bacterium]